MWLVLQMLLSHNLYYINTVGDMPPKFIPFGFMPGLIFILILFNTKKGKQFIDSMPLKELTFIHIIRIPIEIVLWWLFLHNTLPEILTFEGRNFDIIAGLSVPFIMYFGWRNGKQHTTLLLIWNILSLGLLLNIVIHAVLSFPTVFQQFGFEQPNVAFLYFPFFWLVTFIVPIVFFSHFTSLRQLLKK